MFFDLQWTTATAASSFQKKPWLPWSKVNVRRGGGRKAEIAEAKRAQREEARQAVKEDKEATKIVGKAVGVIKPMQEKIEGLLKQLGPDKLKQLPQMVVQDIEEKADLTTKWLKSCQAVIATFASDKKASMDMIPFTDLKEVSEQMKACGNAVKAVHEAKRDLTGKKKK